jgi:2,5-furandicarboxylate decarboxylase 1
MTLRAYLERLKTENRLLHVREPISKVYEIAGVLKQVEPRPVWFEQVRESQFGVIGNLFCGKAAFADYFGIPIGEIIPFMIHATQNRTRPEIVTEAPCQEVVISRPDLDILPILRHCELDGGNYISSGVVIAGHPRWGQNVAVCRFLKRRWPCGLWLPAISMLSLRIAIRSM